MAVPFASAMSSGPPAGLTIETQPPATWKH